MYARFAVGGDTAPLPGRERLNRQLDVHWRASARGVLENGRMTEAMGP